MNTRLNTFLYVVVFSGLGLFSYLFLINYTNLNHEVSSALSSLGAVVFFFAAFNILGFSLIRLSSWINDQYSASLRGHWKWVATYGAVTLLLLALNYGLLVSAKLLVRAAHPFTFPNGGYSILIIVWLVELVIMGLIIANKSIKNTLELQRRAAKLQQENNTARYTALQNQLNPHFLFNSLNTLVAEIEYEPRGAVVFTKNLSSVYRYVLQCQDKPLVTLGEELEFVRAYLFLHEVRLGNCIKWNSSIPEQYTESLLPPLTLQLLVENVIKHNSITPNKPMEIRIEIQNDALVFSNSINHKKKIGDSHHTAPSGIGLQNLSNRYKLILDRDITIMNDEIRFTVKIPLIND